MPAGIPSEPGPSRLLTAQGITHPSPAHGGGIETLGGVSGEISGGRPTVPMRSSLALVVGVVSLLGGIALGAYVLLADRKPVRAESLASKPPSLATAPPVAAAALAEPPQTAPPPSPPAPPPRERVPAVAPPPPRVAPPPPRAAPPPPAKPSPLVTVRFDSAPEGAKVTLTESGKQLGFTPFETVLPRNDLVKVVFTKSGYRRFERTFSTDDDRTIRAALDRAPRRKRCADGSAPPCRKATPPPPKKDDRVPDLKVDDLKGF